MSRCEFLIIQVIEEIPVVKCQVKEETGLTQCNCGDITLTGKKCPIRLTAKQRLTLDQFQDVLDERVIPKKFPRN